MKRILFFAILFFPLLAFSQTRQDSVGVKTISSLTELTANIDTSYEVIFHDPSTGKISYRASVGEFLKTINALPSVIGTSQIINATIINEDISGSAAIALSKLENLTANRLVGRDTTGTGIPESLTVGYGLRMGTDRIDIDTVSASGLVSKSRLTNALDDVGGGANLASPLYQVADGTDTIALASNEFAVHKLSLSATDTTNITITGGVSGGRYILHLRNVSSDYVQFASNIVFPDSTAASVRQFSGDVMIYYHYDGANYWAQEVTGTSATWPGSGNFTISLTGTGFLADQIRTFAEEDYTIFPGAVADDNLAHPSVHFFSTAWNGAKYYNWYTPYPSEADENPYLAYSSDGITWGASGISNPLIPVPPPGDGSNYNSDTDFFYDSVTDTAYLFWRFKNGSGDTDFFYVKSGDGRTVVDSTKIFSNLPNDEWASITVEKIDSKWHAWIVTIKDRPDYKLLHYAGNSLSELQSYTADTCTIDDTPAGKDIWHVWIKYDSTYDQLIGVFNFTDTATSGAPNSNGLQRFATSTDGLTWDVAQYNLLNELQTDNITGFNYDQGYRSSFARLQTGEPLYDRMGGVGIGVMNWNWKFSINPFFVVPKAGKTAGGYEAAASDIESIYSFYYRDSTFQGLPVAQVRIRDTLYNAFPAAKRGQLTWGNSGERLETLAGSDTIFITRWYDQENRASQDDPPNYLSFYGTNKPIMARGPYVGQDSTWYVDFDRTKYHSVKSLTKSKTKGITFAGDYEQGVVYSWQGGAPYLGATGASSAMNIQDSGGYTQAAPDSTQTVISAIWGTNSVIRFEKNQVASGSTTATQDDNVYEIPFSRWSTTAIDSTSFFNGQICELVVWKNQPDTATLEIVEDTLIANFDLSIPVSGIDTLIWDDFVGAAGDADGRQPNIFTSVDTFWNGSTNWDLTGSGSLTAINSEASYLRIFAGVDTTKKITIETEIDFNTSDGWSGVVWGGRYNGEEGTFFIRVDQNNQAYLYRNMPTPGIEIVGQTANTLPGDGIVTIRIEIQNQSVDVYFDDALTLQGGFAWRVSDIANWFGAQSNTLDNDDVEWNYFLVTQE